jgi:hypothetical protein
MTIHQTPHWVSVAERALSEKEGKPENHSSTPVGTLVNDGRDDLWRELAGDMT